MERDRQTERWREREMEGERERGRDGGREGWSTGVDRLGGRGVVFRREGNISQNTRILPTQTVTHNPPLLLDEGGSGAMAIP